MTETQRQDRFGLPADAAKAVELQRLLHLHAHRLLEYLRRKLPMTLRGYVEPQDVLQDTFFGAFQHIDEFDPQDENAVYDWLEVIARNRMLDLIRMHRSDKRGGDRERFGDGEDVIAILQSLAIYSRTPSQSAMSHEAAAAVSESMSRLEPQYSEVIRLRFLEGLSIRQSAERMGRTEAAVMMLCKRGLSALRQQLQMVSLVT